MNTDYQKANSFARLQDDCKSKALEVVVKINHGKLLIEILNADGKTIDNQPVQSRESVEDAAYRLHHKMRKGNIL